MKSIHKWCYVCYEIYKDIDVGVFKKIRSQQESINRLEGVCDLIIYNNNAIYSLINGVENETEYGENLYDDLVILDDYDCLYIRWGGYHKQFNELLKIKNAKKYKIIVEIPTFPIKKELFAKAKERMKRGQIVRGIKSLFGGIYLQDILFKAQIKNIDYLSLISYEKDVRGVKCIHIDNGIDISRYPRYVIRDTDNPIIMMIVANLSYYQGIDRIIEGLRLYKDKQSIELWIVGEGQEKDNLCQLVKKYGLQNSVRFLGVKDGKDLDDLFNECDVAIGSLGMSREGIVRSTLKTREYMARGVPFVASEYEVIGENVKNNICIVPDNDKPISIEEIVHYLDRIDRKLVSSKLREEAVNNLIWDIQMRKVIDGIFN